MPRKSAVLLVGIFLVMVGYFLGQSFSRSVSVIPVPSAASPERSRTTATVEKVIDGDTILLTDGEEVRYIGIDTPEIYENDCFATEAARANSDLVSGKSVTLVKDTSEKDKYGRLLRYVYVGNPDDINAVFINDVLIKNGYAKVMTITPDMKFSDKFTTSESYAKQTLLGLWGKCPAK
jgi:micrococcal nuclease